MARDHRTIRESRRTYKRKRCTYILPDGFRCRAWPEQGSDRCLLHAEPAEE
jgi:hypothetical protein